VSGLTHLTVLEEAHRLLRPDNARDSGVELFVDAIAELRGAGEGFVIVDQTPSGLHPSVLKMTGTKLTHRLTDHHERAAVGGTMVLDAEQMSDLARLGERRMVAYAATGSTATLVDVAESTTAARGKQVGLARETALVTDADEQVLACTECPVMCQGARGRALVPQLWAELRARPAAYEAPALLARALTLVGEDSYAEAYCAAAFVTHHHFRAFPTRNELAMSLLRRSYSARLARSVPLRGKAAS